MIQLQDIEFVIIKEHMNINIKLMRFTHLLDIKNNAISIVLLIIIFQACLSEEYKKFYDKNGILVSEEKLINKKDSIFYSKVYNVKGYLEREGFSDKNGLGNGFWKVYFSDGTLKWKGIVKDGMPLVPDSIINNVDNQYCFLEFKDKHKTLKVGTEYKIRTYVEGIPFSHYILTDSLFNELEINDDEDSDNYLCKFTPSHAGKYEVWIVFPDINGEIVPGKSKAKLFTFKVVEGNVSN